MTTYYIRDWDKHFETAQSRAVMKSLSWVPLPNKHDGKSYRRLMRLPNGIVHYGVWVLLIQVASKCPVRGVLHDGREPLTALDIADKTDVDENVIADAMQVLLSDRIGWLGIDEQQVRPTSAATKDYEQNGDADSKPPNAIYTLPDITKPNITEPNRTGITSGRSVGLRAWEKPNVTAMRHTPTLMAWFDSEAANAGIADPADENRIWALAAAERSLAIGTNKPNLFFQLINELADSGPDGKLRDFLPQARERFKKWKGAVS